MPVSLTDAEVRQLLKAAQTGGGDAGIVTSPRMTLFDGQRAFATVAQLKAYVAGVGYSEVNGQRVSEPLPSTVSSGVVIKPRVAVDEDGSHVALDLQYEQTRLREMRQEPARELGQGFRVEVPVIDREQVDRTLSTSSGRTMLIAIPSADGKEQATGRSRLLLVKPTVVHSVK